MSDAFGDSARGLVPEKGEFRRSGLTLGIAAGPSAAIEFGSLVDVNGVGAGPSLRIGTTAGERLVWLMQLDGAAYLFSAEDDEVGVNQLGVLSLAGQVYALDALWIKGGLGFANYRQQVRRQIKLDPVDENKGIGILAGVGLDLYQEGAIAIGLEASLTTVIVGDGVILQGWSGLGVHMY